jgi:hypothetical protein
MGKIIVEVDLATPDHAVVRVEGVKGKRCKDLTREIERLGHVVTDTPTSEMREVPVANKIRST